MKRSGSIHDAAVAFARAKLAAERAKSRLAHHDHELEYDGGRSAFVGAWSWNHACSDCLFNMTVRREMRSASSKAHRLMKKLLALVQSRSWPNVP